ncbi:hypothetical protein BHE74_00041312 [Ensete ventricosum]|nr:hypothetical protein BHE74_00041312 [Ensete ventricosum]
MFGCGCRVQQLRVKIGWALVATSPVPMGITGSAILSLLCKLLCALKRKAAWVSCSGGSRAVGMATDEHGWKIAMESRGYTGGADEVERESC